jgi:pyruvoyl-dependent arginine decarboxylase (PvlArgDC)
MSLGSGSEAVGALSSRDGSRFGLAAEQRCEGGTRVQGECVEDSSEMVLDGFSLRKHRGHLTVGFARRDLGCNFVLAGT